jgi:hypothetical protein
MSAAVLENIKRSTQATIDAYHRWDLDAILAPRADNCIYQFRPLSLKQPPRNNAEYREYYASQIIPLFQDFKVTLLSRKLCLSAHISSRKKGKLTILQRRSLSRAS